MEKSKKKSGGARVGAGRKPTLDKIQPVYIGIKKSVIDTYGSKETVKEVAEQYINSNVNDV